MTNVTPKILEKVGRNLHNSQGHPLELIKRRIVTHFQQVLLMRSIPVVVSIATLQNCTIRQNLELPTHTWILF